MEWLLEGKYGKNGGERSGGRVGLWVWVKWTAGAMSAVVANSIVFVHVV